MKTLVCLFLSALSLTGVSFAGNEPDACTKDSYPVEIGTMIREQKPFFQEDLSGEVTIWFTVDADQVVHVIDTESENIYLSSHAFEAIDGKVMHAFCLPDDVVYHITVDFAYSI